jgi:hypothetical protein
VVRPTQLARDGCPASANVGRASGPRHQGELPRRSRWCRAAPALRKLSTRMAAAACALLRLVGCLTPQPWAPHPTDAGLDDHARHSAAAASLLPVRHACLDAWESAHVRACAPVLWPWYGPPPAASHPLTPCALHRTPGMVGDDAKCHPAASRPPLCAPLAAPASVLPTVMTSGCTAWTTHTWTGCCRRTCALLCCTLVCCGCARSLAAAVSPRPRASARTQPPSPWRSTVAPGGGQRVRPGTLGLWFSTARLRAEADKPAADQHASEQGAGPGAAPPPATHLLLTPPPVLDGTAHKAAWGPRCRPASRPPSRLAPACRYNATAGLPVDSTTPLKRFIAALRRTTALRFSEAIRFSDAPCCSPSEGIASAA